MFFFANHFSSCSETLFQFFFPIVVTSLKDVSPLKLIFFALFHKSVANIYFLKTTFNDVFHDFLQIFAGFWTFHGPKKEGSWWWTSYSDEQGSSSWAANAQRRLVDPLPCSGASGAWHVENEFHLLSDEGLLREPWENHGKTIGKWRFTRPGNDCYIASWKMVI